jgi:diacylglycerol kinase
MGKDVGAAAVLIASLTSILVGLLLMGPALWERISPLVVR